MYSHTHLNETSWTVCEACKGNGEKRQRVRKSIRNRYKNEVKLQNEHQFVVKIPIKPIGSMSICTNCSGSGLIPSERFPIPNNKMFPTIAIIGGGIGGIALGIACLHRGIPFTIYERDSSFNSRSQGYGLTLQQASSVLKSLGINYLKEGITSTRHVVHTPDGKIIGEWGMRKWLETNRKPSQKRSNIHIARQALRSELMKQLGSTDCIEWNHKLSNIKTVNENGIQLEFKVGSQKIINHADIVVGADGIRSTVRNTIIDKRDSPLHYLGCIVILGICPIKYLQEQDHPLLDMETVFQTANGKERIYVMPYNSNAVMWQLSFPMNETCANDLSKKGSKALKYEALKRVTWHTPLPNILNGTPEELISGYPVYDRNLLSKEEMKKESRITLIGDAAHAMSPFKGQGANQAIIDALVLAKEIYKEFNQTERTGEVQSALRAYESEMLDRSAIKVKESAQAAKILHSELVLKKGDHPRGKCVKN